MFSEEYIAMGAVLDALSFMESCDFGHRIIGTSYIFVPMNCKPGEVAGFWDAVDDAIRDEIIFKLNLFK